MNQENRMKNLLKEKEAPYLPQTGDLIQGKIIKMSKSSIILDLGSQGTGIIYGGEIKENREILKGLKVGDTITTIVLNPENEEGYIELSFKKASLEKSWNELKQKKQTGELITVKVTDANRGGLIIKFNDIIGFLPVSQLSSEHYPRVEGGDKEKILNHLNSFIGQEMKVKIITLEPKDNKLIVSEKALEEKKIKENLEKYKQGDVIEGTVTNLTNFGAFIKFDNNLEGMAHISELTWQIIDHPNQILKGNEKIKAKIIDIQNGQVSLSLKALEEDPWKNIGSKYEDGQTIKGTVIKFSSSGVIIQIDKNIHGLVHVSEFDKENLQMDQTMKIGQAYSFKILSLAPENHKMSLALATE